jgi:hypothetical protein
MGGNFSWLIHHAVAPGFGGELLCLAVLFPSSCDANAKHVLQLLTVFVKQVLDWFDAWVSSIALSMMRVMRSSLCASDAVAAMRLRATVNPVAAAPKTASARIISSSRKPDFRLAGLTFIAFQIRYR